MCLQILHIIHPGPHLLALHKTATHRFLPLVILQSSFTCAGKSKAPVILLSFRLHVERHSPLKYQRCRSSFWGHHSQEARQCTEEKIACLSAGSLEPELYSRERRVYTEQSAANRLRPSTALIKHLSSQSCYTLWLATHILRAQQRYSKVWLEAVNKGLTICFPRNRAK